MTPNAISKHPSIPMLHPVEPLPWKKNKVCFQHVNVDLEPLLLPPKKAHTSTNMVDSPKIGSKIMADFRLGKKNGSKKLGASWKVWGGDERSNWSPRNSVDCNLSANGPAETHRNSSNFGSETLATHRSHPQEIVLFAQVEMLIGPVSLLQALFLTSGAPNKLSSSRFR